MKIYSLYSKSLNRYHLPFFAADDEAAIANLSKMVINTQGDLSLISALDDLRLDVIGIFEPTACVHPVISEISGGVIVIDDLHKTLPLPPTVKERVGQYYGGVRNA